MKKLFFLFAFVISFTFISATNAKPAVDTLPVITESVSIDTKNDTVVTFVQQHPTVQDSLIITTVVNGIKTVIMVLNPEAGALVNHVASTTGIVGFICGIWRYFEKRRLRKKGVLNDRKLKR